MAVVVDENKNGVPVLSSVKGLGEITDREREAAIKLDKQLQERLPKLASRLKKAKLLGRGRSKNKAEAYWEFGSFLRVMHEKGQIIPAETSLFWQNVTLRAPKALLAKDRGPNRIHAAYCFRLAGYPKKTALKREWSEWVYLFDSPSINSEERFGGWDERTMNRDDSYLSREATRLFAQCLNSVLRDIDSSDLDDEELVRCYEGALALSKKMMPEVQGADEKAVKAKLKNAIENNQMEIAFLMEGKNSPEKFAENIVESIAES